MDKNPTRPRHAHAAKTEERVAEGRKMGAELRRIAASELAFYVKTKAAHWTVTGPLFRELHHMLEDQAEVAKDAADDVAERAVQLGVKPAINFSEIAAASIVKDRPSGDPSNREMLEALEVDQTTLGDEIRSAVIAAEEAGDAATVDLLSQIVRKHEKANWYLRQTLARDGSVSI